MKKYAGLISSFTRTEIDQLFAISTAQARTIYYTLLAGPRSKEYARILIVTTKKLGSAVIRNRIRRRVKALFYQDKFYQTAQHDFIFIARRPVVDVPFEQLKELLCKHLANVH